MGLAFTIIGCIGLSHEIFLIDTAGVFTLSSYEAILYGMDFLKDECDQWFGSNRPASQVPQRIVNRLAAAPHKLPPHDVWLKRVIGMPDYPKT